MCIRNKLGLLSLLGVTNEDIYGGCLQLLGLTMSGCNDGIKRKPKELKHDYVSIAISLVLAIISFTFINTQIQPLRPLWYGLAMLLNLLLFTLFMVCCALESVI